MSGAECNSCNAGQGNWTGINGDNSTGDGWVSVSQEPFYEKHDGLDSEFTIINGVYQPIISMTVRAASRSAFLPLSHVLHACTM